MSELLNQLHPKLKPLWEVVLTKRTHVDGNDKRFSVHLTADGWAKHGRHFSTLVALAAAYHLPQLRLYNTEETYGLLPIDWPKHRCDSVAVLCTGSRSPVGFVYL